jgi:protein ImuB
LASPCRIACVRIGRFAIGALKGTPTGQLSARRASSGAAGFADDGARSREPVVAVADLRGKLRVVAASRGAQARGIAVAMALTEARALAADLVALPWDEERVTRAALEVTAALLAASPRVSWAGGMGRPLPSCRPATGQGGRGLWWVDAAGMGSEAKLARKLLAITNGLGFGPARAGVADSAIAAYAATFGAARPRPHGEAAARRRQPSGTSRIVPPGTDAAYLAPFPVTLLDLEDDLAETLRTLGLVTLGQLAALAADEIEARFGPEGLSAHRLARGLDARGPATPRDDVLPTVEVELGGPVSTAEPLLFVLKGALAALGDALHAKGLAAREVALELQLDDGSAAARAVRPARPTSHPDTLFDHCRAALEGWQLPEPTTALRLSAAIVVPASGEQGDLLAPRWVDPAALAAAFDRIRGSEGADAVAVPEARDGHLPGDRGAWTPERAGTPPRVRRARAATPHEGEAAAAALRILPVPVPIHVRLGRAGLAAFKHGDAWHDVTAWCGPERLAPRWWRHGGAAAAGEPAGPRDYYTARTADGTLWLLYRGDAAGRWFLEGWVD